jgi:DNA-binding MarR family transcriptional regulator
MSGWTFITNHGAVLLLISENTKITTRAIAIQLEITERTVQRIVKDMEVDGYITKYREGRANRYQINDESLLRRKDRHDKTIGDFLQALQLVDNMRV